MSELFNAKILLFGEYVVINGACALAMPFDQFSGSLKFSVESDGYIKLDNFYNYLKRSKILSKELNLDKFSEDIDNNIHFDSNIPTGYGLGSSGSLCAAVFHRYGKNYNRESEYETDTLEYIQEILAMMESFFHGQSSGIDPLISYLNKPLLIKNTEKVEILSMPELALFGNFYLLDSKISRKTSPLVHQFLKDCNDDQFKFQMEKFKESNDEIIKSVLEKNILDFDKYFREISRIQYLHFEKMIPKSIRNIWLEGLESKDYFIKLCGAGGGGFFLLYGEKVPRFINLVKIS